MTSRRWYDLVATNDAFDEEKKRTNEAHFGQRYFSLAQFQSLGNDDNLIQYHLPLHLPYNHGGILPSGRDVLGFTASMSNSHLCVRCTNMMTEQNTWQGVRNPSFKRVALAYADLLNSAADGCHICHLQLDALGKNAIDQLEKIHYQEFYFWRVFNNAEAGTSLGRTSTSHGLSIRYLMHGQEDAVLLGDGRVTGLLLGEAEDFNLHYNETPPPLSPINDAATSWAQIQNWVKNCEVNHRICQGLKTKDRKLPTRLLRVDGNHQGYLKVVSTKDLPVETRYMTLSHRWGRSDFHRFIQTCPASYFDNIEVNNLPKLFQDVIKVTHHLAISYLWIDAFCIKQGSKEDWVYESARMGDVYRFSWCNIAASRATSSDETIFAFRHTLEVSPCIIQTFWDCDHSAAGSRWVAFDPDQHWEQNVEKGPLAERAWVVQELALASRVVHYGRKQLFWECSEMRACETLPYGIPGSSVKKLSLHPTCLQFELRRVQPHYRQYHIWSKLIDKYSRCFLTETIEDKLVALSGLAKSIGPAKEYVAGLWKEDLEYQLLWRTEGTSSRAHATGPGFQAPSWSWASVNGAINYRIRESVNDPEAELLIRIVHTKVQPYSDDLTGRVSGGRLRVSGPLAKATLGSRQLGKNEHSVINGGVGQGFPDCADLSWFSDCYCMPVEVKTRKGAAHTLVVGLILHPSPHHNGALQRCAYFTVADLREDHGKETGLGGFWKSFREPTRQPSEVLVQRSSEARTAAAIVYGLPVYDFTIV